MKSELEECATAEGGPSSASARQLAPPCAPSLRSSALEPTPTMSPLTADQLSAIKAASHEVLDEAVAFLQAITRVDTTNPPGLAYREIAVLISDHLQGLGYETELLTVAEEGTSGLLLSARVATPAPHS